MANNFVQDGEALTLTAPYAVTSGQGLLVGSIFGIAQETTAIGLDVVTLTEGVFDITKAVGAITQGAKVYWDNAARNITLTLTSNTLVGAATVAALSGDATVRVRLDGAIR
jgi:predicted RecA/RadA family phage recombinase